MAHVVNLAVQAFLTTHSKSKHFDPSAPDADLVTTRDGIDRDEVGLVRAIVVKERSSAKWKELFQRLQTHADDGRALQTTSLQLLLDMKVRWSSTYVMLRRALELKEYVNEFVRHIGIQERNVEKRQKLLNLELSEAEWDRVRLLLSLLGYAEKAQHAFSTEHGPTLHAALPALEALHKAWSLRMDSVKYMDFTDALEAALRKVSEYYERTASSDAYIMAMILDPRQKLKHIRTYWGEELVTQATQHAEEMARYEMIYGCEDGSPKQAAASGQNITTRNPKLDALLGELSDDETSGSPALIDTSRQWRDPAKPWLQGFHEYLSTHENMGNFSIVQWWGLNAARYPVWASLARDFLSIMATSVSSERAFSSAGITISKRRNRLKADITEALQFMKCFSKKHLLFRDDPSVMSEVRAIESCVDVEDDAPALVEDCDGWDGLVEDFDESRDLALSEDDSDVFVSFMDL
ncbi:ribonuclease H-like domain-containing protein [Pisolithus albus]|nr:ribonuclease H-like domain-containing protein [Pisolithus albus]